MQRRQEFKARRLLPTDRNLSRSSRRRVRRKQLLRRKGRSGKAKQYYLPPVREAKPSALKAKGQKSYAGNTSYYYKVKTKKNTINPFTATLEAGLIKTEPYPEPYKPELTTKKSKKKKYIKGNIPF